MFGKLIILVIFIAVTSQIGNTLGQKILPEHIRSEVTVKIKPSARFWLVLEAGSSYRTLYVLGQQDLRQQKVLQAFETLGAKATELSTGNNGNLSVVRWHRQWAYLGSTGATQTLKPENIRRQFMRAMGEPVNSKSFDMIVYRAKFVHTNQGAWVNSSSESDMASFNLPFQLDEELIVSQWITPLQCLWIVLILVMPIWLTIAAIVTERKLAHDKSFASYYMRAFILANTYFGAIVLGLTLFLTDSNILGGLCDLWSGGQWSPKYLLLPQMTVILSIIGSLFLRRHIAQELAAEADELDSNNRQMQADIRQIVSRRSLDVMNVEYQLDVSGKRGRLLETPVADHRNRLVIVPPFARINMNVSQLDFWITRALQDNTKEQYLDLGVALIAYLVCVIDQYTDLIYTPTPVVYGSLLVFGGIVIAWCVMESKYNKSGKIKADIAAVAITGDPQGAIEALRQTLGIFSNSSDSKSEFSKRMNAITREYYELIERHADRVTG